MTVERAGGATHPLDVRLRGFLDRTSVEDAIRWIDRHAHVLPPEEIAAAGAAGRVVAGPVHARQDLPPHDRAVENGYAVQAAQTAGASNYNPMTFALVGTGARLSPGAVSLVNSGSDLPEGADAVLAFEAAQPNGATLDVFDPLAPGSGVERQAQAIAAGTIVLEPGRVLRAHDLGFLAAAGVDRVEAVRRPRVKLIIAGPKPSASGPDRDANGPMLHSLVVRDGGIVCAVAKGAVTRAAITDALMGDVPDLILVVGRSGTGADDEAPLALAEAGVLAIHGIALRPGGSAGLGLVGRVPVMLLPGAPSACLATYETLAGRLIRRLGGRSPDLPHPSREFELTRKIVSRVGSVDMCQVHIVEGRAEPTGSIEAGCLLPAIRAQGFVLVPAPLEGYAPGSRVTVRLYAEPDVAAVRS